MHASIRDLRHNLPALLARVESGERVTIIVEGRPVAELVPPSGRARWMDRDVLLSRLEARRADVGLSAELAVLNPGTTDDLPLR